MLTLLILYLGIGLVNTLVSLPLILEKVKPNPIYGFRVRTTLENPRVWYAVNQYFGQRFVWAGVILVIAAVLLYWIPGISLDAYALACLAAFLIPFIIAMIQSLQYLRSLTRDTSQ